MPERFASTILYVCMGNICRSPTAEGVTRRRARDRGLEARVFVESAGIGNWHVGEAPDHRAIAHAARRGYDLTEVRARQVSPLDFDRFDWIFAMDRENLRALQAIRPDDYPGHLGLFLDVAPQLDVREVPDPYFGGGDGFERVLDLVEVASDALLARIASGPARPA